MRYICLFVCFRLDGEPARYKQNFPDIKFFFRSLFVCLFACLFCRFPYIYMMISFAHDLFFLSECRRFFSFVCRQKQCIGMAGCQRFVCLFLCLFFRRLFVILRVVERGVRKKKNFFFCHRGNGNKDVLIFSAAHKICSSDADDNVTKMSISRGTNVPRFVGRSPRPYSVDDEVIFSAGFVACLPPSAVFVCLFASGGRRYFIFLSSVSLCSWFALLMLFLSIFFFFFSEALALARRRERARGGPAGVSGRPWPSASGVTDTVESSWRWWRWRGGGGLLHCRCDDVLL